MVKCTACGKFLPSTGVAACSTCPLRFHKMCVGIIEKSTMSKDLGCPECAKNRPKGDDSCTPVKSVYGSPDHATLCETAAVGLQAPSIDDTDIRSMRRELALFMAEVREFRKEFKTSMDSMAERMNRFEHRIKALEQRPEPAEAPGMDEVAKLQQTVVQLRVELNDQEQDAILTDLEIGQLLEEKGENVQHIVTVLAAKLGVPLEQRDVVYAERVGALDMSGAGDGGTRSRARRVVVRLT